MRIITVKGTGNVSARPDYIILSLNIEANSKNYDLAMSEAAERIEKLQGVAVRVGYRKEEGTRSYKVIRTTPDGLSYAKDIARRYRLDLEDILKNCK